MTRPIDRLLAIMARLRDPDRRCPWDREANFAKISRRAARIGFDWPDADSVIDKIEEELDEIEDAIDDRAPPAALEEEIGDLLFATANLARKLDIEPETALRRATAKFERRFRRVEAFAKERGIGPDLEALEALWQEVKAQERK